MIAESVGIGIVVSFFSVELLGLSPGGLVVPGYLAFFLTQPLRVVATFAAAALTAGLVMGCANFCLIYGRRRFMACILIGYCLGYLVERICIAFNPFNADLRVIGYIIPGLIANEMIRQGVVSTVLITVLAAGLVRLLLILLAF